MQSGVHEILPRDDRGSLLYQLFPALVFCVLKLELASFFPGQIPGVPELFPKLGSAWKLIIADSNKPWLSVYVVLWFGFQWPRSGQVGLNWKQIVDHIIDDYGFWKGARKAVDEYFKNFRPFFHYVDHSCRLMIKS